MARRAIPGILARLSASLLAAAAFAWTPSAWTASANAQTEPAKGLQILRTSCGGCHQQSTPDHFARISDIRKTPEGWLMTIFRMQHVHQVQLQGDDRDVLIRYLADSQGLAPSETVPARYALERRPNTQDMSLPGELQTLCARCHSAARIALQRRDSADWLKHVHWHLAQWPTIEYQQSSRDRFWWQTATTEVPDQLGKLFPFKTDAWDKWQTHPRADLTGTWLVRGHEPGHGDFWGTALISKSADGEYSAIYSLDTDSGQHVAGDSKSIVYTGFEWRGTAQLAGRDIREIYAVSEDGQTLSGRWFESAHTELGADWTAVRAGSATRVLVVSPTAVRIGSTTRVMVFGSNLNGKVSFGEGTRSRVVTRTEHSLSIELQVAPGASRGYRALSIGSVQAGELFALYDRVDRLTVTPAFAIARLGGGRIDPVAAQFEALAFLDLPEAGGKVNPVRLGALPVSWSVTPFNEDARQSQDEKFAGRIDSRGRFMPAGAGPNPARKFSANNAGNLSINATLSNGSAVTAGNAHLIVTVQRWNSPPIY